MSSNWRRFEVLLPLELNDGREVPPEWLAEAVLEVVDVPDSDENRGWMKQFKARWKAKLEQLELWMVSYRIDIE